MEEEDYTKLGGSLLLFMASVCVMLIVETVSALGNLLLVWTIFANYIELFLSNTVFMYICAFIHVTYTSLFVITAVILVRILWIVLRKPHNGYITIKKLLTNRLIFSKILLYCFLGILLYGAGNIANYGEYNVYHEYLVSILAIFFTDIVCNVICMGYLNNSERIRRYFNNMNEDLEHENEQQYDTDDNNYI